MTQEDAPNPWKIDPTFPHEIMKQLEEKVEELKAKGYSGMRVVSCVLDNEVTTATAVSKFLIDSLTEELYGTFVHQKKMEDAGDGEKAADVLYVLIAKK